MMDEKLERAMDDELEGTNAPEASAWLREQLARDPESRVRFEELRRVRDGLERIPTVEVPAGLRATVMAAVHAEPRRGANAGRAGLGAWLNEALRVSFSLRAAPAFALGALIAVAGFVAYSRLPVEPGLPVSGTMAPPAGAAAEPLRLAVGATEVTLAWQPGARLALYTRAAEPVEIELSWDVTAGGPAGVEWKQQDSAAIELAPGRLVLRQREGSTGYLVPWFGTGAGSSAVRVTIRTTGGTSEGTLAEGSGNTGR